MLPTRVSLSKNATGKLRYIKQMTGITPNIISRIALMKAINDGEKIDNANLQDNEGQILSRDVLFGDHALVYDVILTQYMHDQQTEKSIQEVIAGLIEIGVHKLGHVKKIQDLIT